MEPPHGSNKATPVEIRILCRLWQPGCFKNRAAVRLPRSADGAQLSTKAHWKIKKTDTGSTKSAARERKRGTRRTPSSCSSGAYAQRGDSVVVPRLSCCILVPPRRTLDTLMGLPPLLICSLECHIRTTRPCAQPDGSVSNTKRPTTDNGVLTEARGARLWGCGK